MDEIELKFLEINVEEIKEKLEKIGAKLIFDTTIESTGFEKEGFNNKDSSMKFLRIRKIDDKIELTYKDPEKGSKTAIRNELEINVNNYNDTKLILEKLGFKTAKIYQKHRMHYELNNICFEIDTNKEIPTYLEIETRTESDMINICKKLDLNIIDGKKGNILECYPKKFKN